jgi:hypothetical protein
MRRNPLEPVYHVRIHYKKGYGDLLFKTKESAAKAVAKVKADVATVGYNGYVSAQDDYGNIEDFRMQDFVRATTSAPDAP